VKVKKIDFTIKDIKETVGNKYAAVIIIANRAKAISENPADVDEKYRKQKPTVTATQEFLAGKIKFVEFDLDTINIGD
jgi:DNA-directed RNA polymerase omega subunit